MRVLAGIFYFAAALSFFMASRPGLWEIGLTLGAAEFCVARMIEVVFVKP